MSEQQKFHVSHLAEEDFKVGGLRGHAEYRDLGIAKATGGLAQAHVIRRQKDAKLEDIKAAAQWHYHDIKFQMIYVLKGWMRSDFKGHGAHTMKAGSCWIQPPGVEHKVLDRSPDCEVLEIILPAEFNTIVTE
jgi:mannose-6-phosphate isomerase-like protein (cupin superfamily)